MINGAITPATIDMIKYEEACFEAAPVSRIDKAKIVENIVDSQAKQRKKQYLPNSPDNVITPSVAIGAPSAQSSNNLSGRRYDINQLPPILTGVI